MTDSRPSMKILESQTFKNLILARKNQMINLLKKIDSGESSGSIKSGFGFELPDFYRPSEITSALWTPDFACLSCNPGYELEISTKIPSSPFCCLEVAQHLYCLTMHRLLNLLLN